MLASKEKRCSYIYICDFTIYMYVCVYGTCYTIQLDFLFALLKEIHYIMPYINEWLRVPIYRCTSTYLLLLHARNLWLLIVRWALIHYAQQEFELNRIKFVLLIYYWILRARSTARADWTCRMDLRLWLYVQAYRYIGLRPYMTLVTSV